MKFGDAFFVKSRFGGTKYLKLFHKNMNLEKNESGVLGAYGPEDYIELPLDTQGIFLEYKEGMNMILFPEYGVGWVFDSWLNKGD
jgi:hypothetical protein